MKRTLLLIISVGLLAITLSECKSSKTATTVPTKTDPYMPTDEIAKAHGVALADLSKGRDLFVGSCDKCHKLPNPSKHDIAGWENTMKAMGPKAHLSAGDADMIVKYLASSK